MVGQVTSPGHQESWNSWLWAFQKSRQGRRGRGVAFNVREGIDCKKLPLRNSPRQAESLQVKDLVGGIPWDTVLKEKGAEQSWQLLKDALLKAHNSPSPSVRQ